MGVVPRSPIFVTAGDGVGPDDWLRTAIASGLGLVLVAGFAVPDGGDSGGFEDFAVCHERVDEPVITAIHPVLDSAF